MAFQPVYLVSAKNLGKFLDAIRGAQTPTKVTVRFVEELGFTSTNDRLFISVLKALRLLDESGKPTARYHEFLDDTRWRRVLADGIRDAYAELFRINKNAHTLPREQVIGKIKSLAEGKMSEAVLGNSVKTFLELVKLADFASTEREPTQRDSGATETEPLSNRNATVPTPTTEPSVVHPLPAGRTSLVYRIEIVLPAVRDQAVYDAIFRSVKQHLLG